MKLLSAVSSLLFAALAVSAQRVQIGAPSDGSSVKAGQNIVVEIDRPGFQSSATEVAVVIGFASCASGHCFPPEDFFGTILYNGPYSPAFQTGAPGSKPQHQNFTVTIPPTASTGPAQLNVAHFSMIGASEQPFLETMNVTLNVVA